MANDPWTGARLGAMSDAPLGGQYLAEAVYELGPWTEPTFSSATARDSALSNWIAAGNVAKDGMRCRTASDKQSWVYVGGQWVWPKGAQGELVRASFTDSNVTTPLQSSPAAALAAFNVSINSLPANRRVEAQLTGSIQADAGNTAYGFLLAFAGFQRRGLVHVPIANTPMFFNITLTFVSPNSTAGATGSVTGSRFAGSGNCFLAANGLESPATYVVRDMGAV